MPRLRRSISALACAYVTVLGLATSSPAARADEVSDLIALARRKPSGMDRDTWLEKRRDAVQKLGEARDKRAVDTLIDIVRTEQFDVVAEKAVVALGKIGDKKAVGVLNEVVNDNSRDRYIRDLARAALAKLGARATRTQPAKPGGSTTSTTSTLLTSTAELPPVPEGPKFGEELLAATERLRFALGSARLQYDTVRDRPSVEGNVAGNYERSVMTQKKAWRYAVDAAVAGGVVDYDGPGSGSQLLVFSSQLGGDYRFYLGDKPFYVMGESVAAIGFTRVRSVSPSQPTINDNRGSADLHFGLRFGYGRIFDKGEALRLRRIEKMLREAKALGRPITADLAEKVLRSWWALRGELGMSRRLAATVSILREAGVLLGEPDAFTTYKMLQILGDGQLNHRLDGWDINGGITTSLLVRDDDLGLEEGRIENAVVRLQYGKQNDTGTQELVGDLYARYRVLSEDGEDSPFSLGAVAAWRNFRYANTYDPIGALEIAAEVALSADGNDQTNTALRIGGRVGWMWILSRASSFRLSANVALEAGELFVGATFEARYGFLDVGFIGRGAY